MEPVKKSSLGCGVGLRAEHYQKILSEQPPMDWFEAVTENYMDSGGRPLHILEQVRSRYPVGLHGVSLSVGSADPLNRGYLQRLKKLIERIEPAIVSDHLCWTSVNSKQLYDLLPLPFTEEAVGYISRRLQEIQTFLGRQILLENVSSYVTYKHSVMPEWEFLSAVAKRSGCGILLDLNNVYVNSVNHGFDPYEYLRHIPAGFVGQYHLAGHTERGDFLFDTHNRPVIAEVWKLYEEALRLHGPVTTLIEWDSDIPAFEELSREADKARLYHAQAVSRKSAPEIPAVETAAAFREAPGGESGDVLRGFEERMLEEIAPYEAGRFPALLQELVLPEGEAQKERLAVYREGYLVRCQEALGETFAAVKHVMGDGLFSELAESYAKKYVLQSPNLNDAGIYFPGFIKMRSTALRWPFLPDLAKLERLVTQAFHAYEKTPFSLSRLSGVEPEAWERSRILFQPSVQLLSSAWPVLDIWRARKTPVDQIRIEMENRPQRVLVFRQGLEVHCDLLDEVQYAFLSRLLEGKALGDVLEELAPEIPSPEWVSEVFGGWFQRGLLTGYKKVYASFAELGASG